MKVAARGGGAGGVGNKCFPAPLRHSLDCGCVSILPSGNQLARLAVRRPEFPDKAEVARHSSFDGHPWPSLGSVLRRELAKLHSFAVTGPGQGVRARCRRRVSRHPIRERGHARLGRHRRDRFGVAGEARAWRGLSAGSCVSQKCPYRLAKAKNNSPFVLTPIILTLGSAGQHWWGANDMRQQVSQWEQFKRGDASLGGL